MNDEVEVMRIVRVPPMGSLVVVVGGERFKTLSQVDNSAVKHRLLAAIGELIVFADGYDALVSAGVAPPAASGLTNAPTQLAPSMEERRAAFVSTLASQETSSPALSDLAAAESQPPAVTKKAGQGAVGPGESLDIIPQIDAILQKHVASDPKLAGRIVRLEQSSGGGLRIEVDGSFYERPGDVTDIDVKNALRDALKEWEAG